MEFDNVISNALKLENDLYNKKYSDSLFRVNRRDKSRLVLTCRYDKSSGIVKFLVKRQSHTCSIKDSIKSTSAAKFDLKKVYCFIQM